MCGIIGILGSEPVAPGMVDALRRLEYRRYDSAGGATLRRLRGAFGLAFLFAGEDDLLVGARRGSPLAVGYGDGEIYLGSDAIALAPFTNAITYLDDGDFVVLKRGGAAIQDATGKAVTRPMIRSTASAFLV